MKPEFCCDPHATDKRAKKDAAANKSSCKVCECMIQAWQQHEAELFNFLASRLNTLEDAEDLIQELFIRLLQQGEKFCSIKQPRAWLYHVARNALIDRYRKQRSFVELDENLYGGLLEGRFEEQPEKRPDTLFPEPFISISEGLISEPFISESLISEELNPAVMDLLDRCLWRNLEELPPEELAIIRQCDLNGMRQKTFAQQNGLSLPATKARLQRARQKLRGLIIHNCQVRFDATGKVCCHTPRND